MNTSFQNGAFQYILHILLKFNTFFQHNSNHAALRYCCQHVILQVVKRHKTSLQCGQPTNRTDPTKEPAPRCEKNAHRICLFAAGIGAPMLSRWSRPQHVRPRFVTPKLLLFLKWWLCGDDGGVAVDSDLITQRLRLFKNKFSVCHASAVSARVLPMPITIFPKTSSKTPT